MSGPRIWMNIDFNRTDAGVLLYGRVGWLAGGAVFRVVRYSQIDCHVRPDGQFTLTAFDAIARYAALYSPATLANGWEPFAQPAPAAYIPRRHSDLIRLTCSAHALLVEKNAYRGNLSFRCDPQDNYLLLAGGEVPDSLRPAAEWVASAANESADRIFDVIVAMGENRANVTQAA